MRRSIAKKGQDICFFCALRLEAASLLSLHPSPRQLRTYKSSAPSWRPAGAAVAHREDDDESGYAPARRPALGQASNQSAELFWNCKCGHCNQLRRVECTLCGTPKPTGAQLVQKPTQDSQPPPQAQSPPQAQVVRPPTRTPPARKQSVPRILLSSRLSGAPRFQDGQTPSRTAPLSSQRFQQDSWNPHQSPAPQRRVEEPNPQKSRFGAFMDNATQQPHQSQRARFGSHFSQPPVQHTQPQIAERGTRFGSFLSELAQNPRPAPPSRPSNPNVTSGLDALLQATSASERPTPRPTRGPAFQGLEASRQSTGRLERPQQRPQRTVGPDARTPGPISQGQASLDPRAWKLPEKAISNSVDEPFDDLKPALPIAEDVDEDLGFGRRRKGDKNPDRHSDRRRERFELGDTAGSSNTTDFHANSRKPPVRGRRDPFATAYELEMADVEARMFEDEDGGRRRKKRKEKKQVKPAQPRIEIPEFISVENLAKALKVKLEKFIGQLEEEGFEGARYDHVLDSQTSTMFAELHGFEAVILEADARQDIVARPPPEDPSILPPRPPIVTIMGHVDHGKTTILDWLRKSSVVASEHGGITQHIGAFSVSMPGTQRSITFLDTPGHAAFLDMRRRGANVTDIVVLVVAADDSVKPQTIEAIKHAKEAGVHIIVAINKVDKEDANIEKVKQDLAVHEVYVESLGGEIQAIPLSGKTGQGMEALEEAIITLADVSDFRAEADGPAEGAIIESKVTPAGRVATILVRRGTLRTGDFIVAGNTWARVRTLRNDAGQLVEEAPPGAPVQVDGWRGEDPTAGLEVLQADDEQHAKDAVGLRMEKTESIKLAAEMATQNANKSAEAEARAKILAWEREQGWKTGRIRGGRPWDNEGWVEPTESSGPRRVHFVVKADVAGSVEAIEAVVSAIGNNDVVANVVHSGTGHLGESDIRLLAATGEVSYAINFNQPIEGTIHRLAEAANIQILDHNIIYKVTDQVKEKLSDELPPLITYKVLGEAEVGQIFEISTKKGKVKVAGCKVTNGTISRSQKVKVLRGEDVIYTGPLDSLKNVKKDMTEMRKGTECGMSFDNWEDFQDGDKIQCFEELREKRKLY